MLRRRQIGLEKLRLSKLRVNDEALLLDSWLDGLSERARLIRTFGGFR